jgi:hypothetical protein
MARRLLGPMAPRLEPVAQPWVRPYADVMEKAVRTLLLAALGPFSAEAHEKPLPPAFGKELVPDGQAEHRQEAADSDADDESDEPGEF